MVAQFKIVLLAAIFAAARSQAPVGGPHGRPHVARYLRGEGREDEEAPALHYFATDPEWKYVAVRRTASEPVELFDVASESDKPVARFAFEGEPPEIYAGATEYIILLLKYDLNEVLVDPKQVGLESITFMFFPDPRDPNFLALADATTAVFVNRELKVIERWSGTIEELFEKFSICRWFDYTQQVVLEDAPEGSRAGESVAISDSGDVVAVGAPWFAEGGRVRMYVRSSTTLWPQLGTNDILGGVGERLGTRLALSGDGSTVAVDVRRDEGPSLVRIYRLSEERKTWGLIGSIPDESRFAWRGIALSRDGNRVAIGDGVKTVRVFELRAGPLWVQLGGDMTGGYSFGSAVDLNAEGTRVAVGEPSAPSGNGQFGGAAGGVVRVYEFDGSSWKQLGGDIAGDWKGDWSGYSVALDGAGEHVAIGAPDHFDNPVCGGNSCGQARVFEFDGTSWAQLGLDIDAAVADLRFGVSVDLSGDGLTLVVGAPGSGFSGSIGTATAYKFFAGSWGKLGLRGAFAEGAPEDLFGSSVAVAADDAATVVVGAPSNDAVGDEAGHARVFEVCQ